MLKLGFIKLSENAYPPKRARDKDACWDVFSIEDVIIYPNSISKISTGLRLVIPSGYRIDVKPRSGLAAKHGIMVVNSPGTIDESYGGEIIVILTKITNGVHKINVGDRIAQISLERVIDADIEEMQSPPENFQDRGGGLGSTGQ